MCKTSEFLAPSTLSRDILQGDQDFFLLVPPFSPGKKMKKIETASSHKAKNPHSVSRSAASSVATNHSRRQAAAPSYDALVLRWASTARIPPYDRMEILKRLGATVNKLSELTGCGEAPDALLTQIGTKLAELEDIQHRPVAEIAANLTRCSDLAQTKDMFDISARLEIVFGNRSEAFLGQRAVADELLLQSTSFAPFAAPEAPLTWRSSDSEHEICSRTVFLSNSEVVFFIHDTMTFCPEGDTRKIAFLQRYLLLAGTAVDVASDLNLHFGVTSMLLGG